ncbi:protein-export chaperone SecB [Cloacibacterium caeni]|jgi:preprotein translocase subunit SecB|uniref:protein-export chaperone SecB n=1 Tax=Cloacibacterium caeni TaxID=2004710 RepID=UPI001BCF6D66|nr:protein-export chaperone SecB [Cloacibacterium caeni]
MKIQLKNWKIANLSMSLLDERTKRDNDSFDLESGNFFSDDEENNTFGVAFKLNINDRSFDLIIEAFFNFEIVDEKITEDFKLSSFPKINAPAIAFPYLRAFVSNLTLQSGLEPVILPSINFVQLANNDSSIKE